MPSSNPVQAHQRALRKRELKKNKHKRLAARDAKVASERTVSSVSAEIDKLEKKKEYQNDHLDNTDTRALERLRKELRICQSAEAARLAQAESDRQKALEDANLRAAQYARQRSGRHGRQRCQIWDLGLQNSPNVDLLRCRDESVRGRSPWKTHDVSRPRGWNHDGCAMGGAAAGVEGDGERKGGKAKWRQRGGEGRGRGRQEEEKAAVGRRWGSRRRFSSSKSRVHNPELSPANGRQNHRTAGRHRQGYSSEESVPRRS